MIGSSGIWSVLSLLVRGAMLCMSCCLRAVLARSRWAADLVAASSSGVAVGAAAGSGGRGRDGVHQDAFAVGAV
jgi:hypothetical protein